MQKTLSEHTQALLRQEKIITQSEVAIQFGDKYIAQDIITNTRREITVPNRLIEGIDNKRVLKG